MPLPPHPIQNAGFSARCHTATCPSIASRGPSPPLPTDGLSVRGPDGTSVGPTSGDPCPRSASPMTRRQSLLRAIQLRSWVLGRMKEAAAAPVGKMGICWIRIALLSRSSAVHQGQGETVSASARALAGSGSASKATSSVVERDVPGWKEPPGRGIPDALESCPVLESPSPRAVPPVPHATLSVVLLPLLGNGHHPNDSAEPRAAFSNHTGERHDSSNGTPAVPLSPATPSHRQLCPSRRFPLPFSLSAPRRLILIPQSTRKRLVIISLRIR